MRKKQLKGRRGKSIVFGRKEKRRLLQLVFCAAVFFLMLIGHSSKEGVLNSSEDRFLNLLRKNIDFASAFSDFGQAVSEGESIADSFAVFGEQLLGLYEEQAHTNLLTSYNGPATIMTEKLFSSGLREEVMLEILGAEENKIEFDNGASANENNNEYAFDSGQEDYQQEEEQDAALKGSEEGEILTETVLDKGLQFVSEYEGPTLPANASMEYYELGLSDTVTPVLGELSSPFGYRIHPMSGESTFHAGVDIAAKTGVPVSAFADGVVEYIGESDRYGLYVQLDHGNGIKTFYCHCSELLLGKGKRVEAGQTIALVGDTGDTTGSHLHMELKRNDILINPIYYIETIS